MVAANVPQPLQTEVAGVIEELRATSGTTGFKEKYHRFRGILADHMQVLGPVVAPYLPPLAAMLT